MGHLLRTRLTERFDLTHPIVLAPMGNVSGGRLAAAVSGAGGLGLIGGGYGDASWLEAQFREAGNAKVGCGFITWSLAERPELLEAVLERRPKAIMLSFGDPTPFAGAIAQSGIPLICQCQTLEHVRRALEVGAAMIVAQGSEAGGHGAQRGTMSFVPEVFDCLARKGSDALVLAGGGIADGRGVAAALALGADGVVMGTRFCASAEALFHANLQAALVQSDGDLTIRTTVPDKARGLAWPEEFTIRVLDNAYVRRWKGRELELAKAVESERPRYFDALARGDVDNTGVLFGEAAGLVHSVQPAAEIVHEIVREAVNAIGALPSMVSPG